MLHLPQPADPSLCPASPTGSPFTPQTGNRCRSGVPDCDRLVCAGCWPAWLHRQQPTDGLLCPYCRGLCDPVVRPHRLFCALLGSCQVRCIHCQSQLSASAMARHVQTCTASLLHWLRTRHHGNCDRQPPCDSPVVGCQWAEAVGPLFRDPNQREAAVEALGDWMRRAVVAPDYPVKDGFRCLAAVATKYDIPLLWCWDAHFTEEMDPRPTLAEIEVRSSTFGSPVLAVLLSPRPSTISSPSWMGRTGSSCTGGRASTCRGRSRSARGNASDG